LRLVLLADLVYVLVVAALVLSQVARLVAARRAKSAGSRLHLRLTGAFALLALIPTVTVAVFAGLTVNIGLEGWFSDRVSRVVGNSLAAAEAYKEEQREDLAADARALARYIDTVRGAQVVADREVLTEGQLQVQRGLREAYIIDGTGDIRARGDRSYLFDYEEPGEEDFDAALELGIQILEDWPQNEFRALVPLASYVNR
ncbi:MAG: PAS domain-containing sensor histidine kinase, partial [Pseudomonadota bacterium]